MYVRTRARVCVCVCVYDVCVFVSEKYFLTEKFSF